MTMEPKEQQEAPKIRLGRIGYLNILPVYHPLEADIIQNHFTMVSGPPAELNQLMAKGELDLASVSSIEYARRPERYYLLPNLAIGSRGPVQSVLLLSRTPIDTLNGKHVLVSAQTHTSAALLKVLFTQYQPTNVTYETGSALERIQNKDYPDAIMAIGDEALILKDHEEYPYRWDLGEVWRQWTGLPFIFGVWVARRDFVEQCLTHPERPCQTLIQAKEWGVRHMEEIISVAEQSNVLPRQSLKEYFKGLVYDLGPEEQKGLEKFFQCLVTLGEIEKAPELEFLYVPSDSQKKE